MTRPTLDSIDEIRRRLTPERLERHGVTAPNPPHVRGRHEPDGPRYVVYSPYPLDPWDVPRIAERARERHAHLAVAPEGLRGMPTEVERRMRTERHLEWLRGWGMVHQAERDIRRREAIR